MHITFLTRKFPPQKGGMETFSYELTSRFGKNGNVIHYGHTQRDIFWAIPALFFGALKTRRTTDVYHLGDLVLAPLAPFLRRFTNKPVVVTVHGLELTYNSTLLRWLIDSSLQSIDAFVCVSEHTASLLKKRGVADDRITVIGHGVQTPTPLTHVDARAHLSSTYDLDSTHRPLLITCGRLVRRKGVAWFVERVLPRFKEMNPLYVIVSDGPDRERIEKIVQEKNLSSFVRFLGKIPDADLHAAYAAADIFVMPNIATEHDVEGFGFVGIEAASYGTCVVSSRVDGIPDAIHHEKNGFLVEPGNAEEYEKIIRYYIEHPAERAACGKKAREYTRATFRWDTVVMAYKKLFARVVSKK